MMTPPPRRETVVDTPRSPRETNCGYARSMKTPAKFEGREGGSTPFVGALPSPSYTPHPEVSLRKVEKQPAR